MKFTPLVRIFTLAILGMWLVASCSSENIDDRTNDNSQNSKKTIKSEQIYYITSLTDKGVLADEKFYDEQGRLIRWVTYDATSNPSERMSTTEVEYNAAGLKSKETTTSFSGVEFSIIYTYDEKGQNIMIEDMNQSYYKRQEFEYDEHGNIVTTTTYNNKGLESISTNTYAYNSKGQIIHERNFMEDNDGFTYDTYNFAKFYDEFDREIELRSYFKNDECCYFIWKTFYDEEGRISMEKDDTDGFYNLYEYNESGLLVLESYYTKEDKRIEYTEHKYDEYGTLIQIFSTYESSPTPDQPKPKDSGMKIVVEYY